MNLVNCEPFAKILLANIHRYTKNVFGIYTDFSLRISQILLAYSFYVPVWFAKISPAKIFSYTIFLITTGVAMYVATVDPSFSSYKYFSFFLKMKIYYMKYFYIEL